MPTSPFCLAQNMRDAEILTLLQMSKAEKQMQKKEKAKTFSAKKSEGKVAKNAKRWK